MSSDHIDMIHEMHDDEQVESHNIIQSFLHSKNSSVFTDRESILDSVAFYGMFSLGNLLYVLYMI